MIIVGYPGIGKTWASKCSFNDILDIDSIYFRDRGSENGWLSDGKGLDNYIWLLKTLNLQGKTVMASSHKEVRAKLLDEKGIDKRDIVYICPDPTDKNAWLARLYNRWLDSTEMKDWYAYRRAIKNYELDTKDMISDREKGVRVLVVSEKDLDGGLLLYLIGKKIIKYRIGMEEVEEEE